MLKHTRHGRATTDVLIGRQVDWSVRRSIVYYGMGAFTDPRHPPGGVRIDMAWVLFVIIKMDFPLKNRRAKKEMVQAEG